MNMSCGSCGSDKEKSFNKAQDKKETCEGCSQLVDECTCKEEK